MRINMNYEEKAGIMNEGEMVNDENAVRKGSEDERVIDDLKDIVSNSEQNNGKSIVIKGNEYKTFYFFMGRFLFSLIFLVGISFMSIKISILAHSWILGAFIIFWIVSWYDFANTTQVASLEIDLETKEAFYNGTLYTDSIQEIVSISVYINPIFPTMNSIRVIGKNSSLCFHNFKNPYKVRDFANRFLQFKQTYNVNVVNN